MPDTHIHRSSRIAACSVICAISLVWSMRATVAQTVLGTASVYQDSLPRLFKAPATSDITASVPDPIGADTASPSMRHLPNSESGWRIAGEAGTLAWQIYMTAPEAAQTQRFRLAYRPSVSVLPDISKISVIVNGTNLGRTGIAAPGDLKPIELAIPSNLLRHGFNDVRISIDERHRVDCSPDATYELWTDIEPKETGFLSPRSQSLLGLTELAGLRPRPDGRFVIRALFDGKIKPKRVEQTIAVSQTVALAANADAPLVSFVPDPDADFGIDVLIGTADELSGAIAALPDHVAITGPTLSLLPGKPGMSPTLVVAGRTDEELADAIARLGAATEPDMITKQAHDAVRNAGHVNIHGGETVRLQDLGLSSIEFSGRVFRLPIDIEMPSDFLAADYDKLSVDLSGAYASGLLASAQVQVNVNGKNSASVPLPNASGGLFHHDDIFVPLTALRPGHNVLEIAATVPSTSDKSCDTSVSIDESAKRFLLLGDTEIRFPRLARVGQTPDLALAAAGGYPYSAPGSKPTLYIPRPDRDAMTAALTLAVRLAIAAGHPIPFDLAFSNPGRQAGHGLIVAPARSLDPTLMTDTGLDPDAVQRSWKDRVPVPDTPATIASAEERLPDQQPLRPRLVTAALREPAPELSLLSVNAFQDDRRAGPSAAWANILTHRSYLDQARDLIDLAMAQISRWALTATASVRAWLAPQPDVMVGDLPPKSALIIAEGYPAGDNQGVISIVTAPDSETLARSVEALVDPAHWSELNGRLAILDDKGRVLRATKAASVQFMTTQPPSLGNLRLIAAGWLSLHPSFYAGFALLLAGVLALFSHLLVKTVGRSNA